MWAPQVAMAHPLSEGSLDITVHPAKVTIRARVTTEEIGVTNMLLRRTPATTPSRRGIAGACDRHAAYLASHLQVLADGQPLQGAVTTVVLPVEEGSRPTTTQAEAGADASHAVYELEYPAGAIPSSSSPWQSIMLRDDVLTEVEYAPGTKWDATYVVSIHLPERGSSFSRLLTARQPITFECDASSAESASQADGATFRAYFVHGVHHILTGYDHLLFISALVLAATTLLDLVKVVTAFTLAHTLTLTLAARNLVHLPETVVEPLISASIVFVAVQNLFWPRRSTGWIRLAAAFFFGLFHGLGFASGLLDAMRQMPTGAVLLAILAFSIGVETGHQMIVIPLFAALRLVRSTSKAPEEQARISLFAQRFGSAVISLAGIFYFILALRLSFAAPP
jgi:hydrogenase/urease accessory protein HupE